MLSAACQTADTNTTNTTTNTAAANTPAPVKAATPSAELADVDTSKPLSADKLNTDFFSDQDAWKGKKVAVEGGKFNKTMNKNADGSFKSAFVNILDDKGMAKVICEMNRQPADDEFKSGERHIFKGVVKDKFFDKVLLNPCEDVKK